MGTISQNERNKLLNIFVDVDEVIEKCQPLYDRFAELQSKKDEINRVYKQMQILRNVSIGALVVYLLVFFTIAYHGGVVIALGVLIAAVAVAAYFIYRTSELGKNGPPIVKKINQEQNSILEEIDAVYNRSPINGVFPQKYVYQEASDFCYELIENLRADSIKEAINLYETQMHNARMEALQHSSLATLNEIHTEAVKTRNAARFAAVASGISAYNSSKIKKNTASIVDMLK